MKRTRIEIQPMDYAHLLNEHTGPFDFARAVRAERRKAGLTLRTSFSIESYMDAVRKHKAQ